MGVFSCLGSIRVESNNGQSYKELLKTHLDLLQVDSLTLSTLECQFHMVEP